MSQRERPRVLITHQGCVPTYRRPFFDRLGRSPNIDYVIAVGQAPRGTGYMVANPPYAFETLRIHNHELPIGGRTLIWQPLARRYWNEFDAVVLGEELKYVSHLALAAISKVRGRPFLWWGFGAPPAAIGATSQTPTRSAAAEFVTRQLRRQASGYLAYTESGRAMLQKDGFDGGNIAVLNNVVDIEAQRALRATIQQESDAELRAALGLPADLPVLLFFGRFLADKQVDVLIKYVLARRAAGKPVLAVISGTGAEEARLRAMAEGSPDVAFRKLSDLDPNMARALRLAKAVVIPGFVGLAITHGFAHGVPMITREGIHPPEIEYLKHGENGLLLPEDEAAFFAGIDAYLASPEQQAILSAGADRWADTMTMDAMAQRFDALLQRLLQRSGKMALSPQTA